MTQKPTGFDTIITKYHFDLYSSLYPEFKVFSYLELEKSDTLESVINGSQGALLIRSDDYYDILNLASFSLFSPVRIFGYMGTLKDTGQERIYPNPSSTQDCHDYMLDSQSILINPQNCQSFSLDTLVDQIVYAPFRNSLVSFGEYKRALFLDRDGVINVDHGYVHQREHFEFVEGVIDFLKSFECSEIMKLIVTNQAGVARGYFLESTVASFHEFVKDELMKNGVKIDAIEIAPYHFKNGIGDYKKYSFLRKPGVGMLFRHLFNFPIDLSRSWMIGDKTSDVLNIDILNYALIKGRYQMHPFENITYDNFDEIKTYLFSLDFSRKA